MNTFTRQILLLLVAPLLSSAQGTLKVTFDGPPLQPTNTAYLVQQYTEAGFLFVPLSGSDGFTRTGSGSPLFPNNGTAYLQAGFGDSLAFYDQNAPSFSLLSVELAGFSTGAPDFSVAFIGYKSDGNIVSTNFSGTGISFRTVYWDQPSQVSHESKSRATPGRLII